MMLVPHDSVLSSGGAQGGVRGWDSCKYAALWPQREIFTLRKDWGLYSPHQESWVRFIKSVRASALLMWSECRRYHLMLLLSCPSRDNYGFITYYNTDDAFGAIENGSNLRRVDEHPFDICFGGRRQFCKSNYADLGWLLSYKKVFAAFMRFCFTLILCCVL